MVMEETYYKDTLSAKRMADNVISLDEYKAKLLSDSPEMESAIDWSFFQSGACYSNALFLCYHNYELENADEWLDYCEGLVIVRRALLGNTPTVVHHSWIYSSKYECYVDCTPVYNPNHQPSQCLYYLSDTLQNYALSDYIESLEDDYGTFNPHFIHTDVPLGLKVPKEWLM